MIQDGLAGVAGCFTSARARPVIEQGRPVDRGEMSTKISGGWDKLISIIREKGSPCKFTLSFWYIKRGRSRENLFVIGSETLITKYTERKAIILFEA